MATRYGTYGAQPYDVPPVDYGTAASMDPPADYNKGNVKSHYPFSAFPDSYNGVKTSPQKEHAPSEPPADYDSNKPAGAHSPVSHHRSPASHHHSPTNHHHSPTSHHHSPTNHHHSPTSHHSPMSHQSPGSEDKSSSPQSDKSYGHGAVPLPDYNSPDAKRRVFGKGADRRFGLQDFSQHRSIGVPVLPPLAPSAMDREPGKVGAGQNRAWLHHLKNHRKFDTLNSFRSVDDCPICQAMDSSDVALTMRHRNRRQVPQSPIVTGEIYQPPPEPIKEVPEESFHQHHNGETQETLFMQKLNTAGVVVARAVQDRVARKPEELTVVQGELLEVGLFHSKI